MADDSNMYQVPHLQFYTKELVRDGTLYPILFGVTSAKRGSVVVINAILSPAYTGMQYIRLLYLSITNPMQFVFFYTAYVVS